MLSEDDAKKLEGMIVGNAHGHYDEHIEQLRPYLELGFTHLVFHAPGDGQTRFIELYGSQILPRIRKQWQ